MVEIWHFYTNYTFETIKCIIEQALRNNSLERVLLLETLKDCGLAFLLGGVLCVIGQLFIDWTKLTPARILVCYVTAGVILGAVGLYKPLVEIFGCGATVPLTGFGYTLAKGVKESVEELGLLGALTGGLTGAAAGITAAMLFGFLAALISKPKSK